MAESTKSLWGLLAGVPQLTGARCKGRAHLFDCDDGDPEIIQYAIFQCRACPALAPCGAWVENLRPSQRPLGVTAAVMRRPKPCRSRAAQTDRAGEDRAGEDRAGEDGQQHLLKTLLTPPRERNP